MMNTHARHNFLGNIFYLLADIFHMLVLVELASHSQYLLVALDQSIPVLDIYKIIIFFFKFEMFVLLRQL